MGRINYGELTSFDECDNLLGRRDKRKLRYMVWLVRDGADITIVHHTTPIIRYRPDGTVVLDCRGYRSATTKDNLNRYTDFRVWQKDRVWYISVDYTDEQEYSDGMEIAGAPSCKDCAV
jgi:hypothetical protein